MALSLGEGGDMKTIRMLDLVHASCLLTSTPPVATAVWLSGCTNTELLAVRYNPRLDRLLDDVMRLSQREAEWLVAWYPEPLVIDIAL